MTIDINNLRTAQSTPKEQLQELHTGSLLKRLELLRSLQGSFEESDWLPEERDAVAAVGLIAFKNTESWKSAFLDVKAILAERENIPRGSKAKRREAAQKNRIDNYTAKPARAAICEVSALSGFATDAPFGDIPALQNQ